MQRKRQILARWLLAGAAMTALGLPGMPVKATALGDLDAEVKQLTQKISGTIVRVHLDQTQDMSPTLRAAYEKYLKDNTGRRSEGRGGPGGGGLGAGGGPPRGGGGGAMNPGGPGGARGGVGGGMGGGPGGGAGAAGGGFGGRGFDTRRLFLEEEMNTTKDSAEIAEIRALLALLARAGQGDMGATIIDNDGHALLLMPLLKDKDHPKLAVTLADGTETTATIVGVDFVRGMTMLKLDNHGATFSRISDLVPVPGEILLSVTANRGTAALMVSPISSKSESGDDHFPIMTPEDRGPTFMFDINGQLIAINLGGRQGLPLATLTDKLGDLLDGKDLIPTPIGIRYTAVPDSSPWRVSTATVAAPLGTQPAALVTGVIGGSLADTAGFKKGDFLVAIDGKPLSPQFFTNPSADLENRTGTVTFGVVRDKNTNAATSAASVWIEVELKVNLDKR